MDIFRESRQKWTSFKCLFYVFLKINVQNENIFAWQKFQIFFGVLDNTDFFGGKQKMLGPILRMKKK